jgi:hypothetical protein
MPKDGPPAGEISIAERYALPDLRLARRPVRLGSIGVRHGKLWYAQAGNFGRMIFVILISECGGNKVPDAAVDLAKVY